MKIWMLTSEMPQALCGGIARYLDNMGYGLAEAGDEVKVIGPGDAARRTQVCRGYERVQFQPRELLEREVEANIPAEKNPIWPYNVLSPGFALAYQMADEVEALIEEEGSPDIIEIPEYGALGVYLLQRKRLQSGVLSKIPVVVMLHTPTFVVRKYNQESPYLLPHYWMGEQEKASIFGADAIIAPSRFIAEELRHGLGSVDLEITVIPLPEGPRLESKIEAGNARDLLFFGRLEARKGVLELLKAARKLWARGVDFKLTLLGPSILFPPKQMEMSDFIRERYGREIASGCLELVEGLPFDQAQARLKSAGSILIPSLWENFPNTCMEAMEAGKVVVASKSGGMQEMLGDDSAAGILFSWEDSEGLESAMLEAIGLTDGERLAMGRVACERIRGLCHQSKVIARRRKHYETVIRNHHLSRLFPFVNREQRKGCIIDRIKPIGEKEGTPFVSVVIPFYNLGDYVDEALQSVLASKGVAYEVIIINDGSTDSASMRKLTEIEDRGHPQVRVVHQENQGLAQSRNNGARLAKGDLVAFVDADDRILPDFLCRAVDVFLTYDNVHVVASWVRYFDQNEGVWLGWNFQLPYMLAHNLIIPICVVHREAFLTFGLNKPEMVYGLEDYEGWISMLAAGCGGVVIPEILAEYRVRDNSMFQSINRMQQLHLYEVILDHHAELYQRYGAELFQLLNANGPVHEYAQPTTWNSPYDSLWRRLMKPIEAERIQTANQWRETVRLRALLDESQRNAEAQWKESCELRERLSMLEDQLRTLASSENNSHFDE